MDKRSYQRVMRKSSRLLGRYIIVDYTLWQSVYPKLGIAASKKFGKAHVRNRFKRIVREAFRLSLAHKEMPLCIIVRPRKYALYADMWAIQNDLKDIVKKIQTT